MEERNDSAGETDEFRCAACQILNGCQEKKPRRHVAHGPCSDSSNIMGDSESLQHVDTTSRAASMEDRDEMACLGRMPLTPWGVIKREMIGWA